MSTQHNPVSGTKTLCGISKGLGHEEVIIEFNMKGNCQSDGANENRSNQDAQDVEDRPSDETVVWYEALGETEKQIKGLALHETLGHPPFVVLSTNDNSFLLFEVSPMACGTCGDVKSITVTRLTESDSKWLVPCSIQVDFSLSSEDISAYINLNFAIAVCHGFFNCISQWTPKRSNSVYQRLFALTLFSSIVRKRLPIGESLIKNTRTVAAVDKLWAEALSQEHAGQLLWVDNIAKEVHRAVNWGIHTATTDQLKRSIPFAIAPGNLKNDDNKKHHIARLVTIWLESMAIKGKPSVSASWDKEWDMNWSENWEKNWVENWRNEPEYPPSSRCFIQQRVPISTNSPLSGSTAGTAMIETALVASTIPNPQHFASIEVPTIVSHKKRDSTQVIRTGQPPSSVLPAPPINEIKEKTDITRKAKGKY